MELNPITIDINEYPFELRPYLDSAKLYDNSGHSEARVIFIDKNDEHCAEYRRWFRAN